MKGTSARGRWKQEDDLRATTLAASTKARAENVMIVDLLRNDIGRIAETGSVSVPHLFAIERYPTLWQMTSTVEGRVASDVRLMDVLRALFPCGSVTGAPKIRTMEIIADTERAPRGLYTGAIGLLEPGGACTFNVAIRTIVIDRRTSVASMGVGAGITLDSAPQEEYAECLLKAAFASSSAAGVPHRFALLETLRLEDGVVLRLDRHLSRMHGSAEYFGFPWNDARVREAVQEVRAAHLEGCWRVRLTFDHRGVATAIASPHAVSTGSEWRVAFAHEPVDSHDPFLFNKTTNRTVYDRARRSRPDVDDVMLWNERGEVTESTIANVVVEIDGTRYTPPLTCGLLPGVLRADLLDSGIIRERILSRGELARASHLWLINSLRGWIEATLVR